MGIKGEAIEWFTSSCLEKKTLAELRRDIIRVTPAADKDYWPVIAVDASVWHRAALGNPRDDSIVLSQYHATPLVPVTAVADYFMRRVNLLKKHKFHVILVFDGQRNPLKSQENDIRQAKADRETLKQKLKDMYDNPQSHTMCKVIETRKQLMSPRKDISYEVIHAAEKNKINVVGAPYETDTQIVALQGQGIIDAAISTDSDFTAMGVRFVVSDLTLKGKVEVRSYHKLTTKVLPNLFGVKDPVVGDDLNFLVQMLGNDNLPKGLRNSGKADVINRMKEYLRKPSIKEKQQYVDDYIKNHDTPTQCLHSLNYWQHGPAYKVIPNNDLVDTPKKAFFSGEYTVKLCSMSLDEMHQYEPADDMIGFIPEDNLRDGHQLQQYRPTHDEFFRCISWSRDGLPFEQLPEQFNNSGQPVLHVAVINFDDKPDGTPLPFVPSRNLEWFLECRGVPSPSLKDREQILDMVKLCRKYNIDPLPSYVMRSGGGCVTYCIMKFANEADAIWCTGDDALRELRSDKCPKLEVAAILESQFEEQHNSKRGRCLSHMFDGSYDIKDLKVTSNLKSELNDEVEDLFVISFLCAPSQKGLGSEEKVYPVRLAFWLKQDGEVTLLPFPYSICCCPVGICKCAHKLGMLLVIHAIRGPFRHLNFEELMMMMPPNIHAVAKQCHLVRHLYPPLDSAKYADDVDIAANTTEEVDAESSNDEAEEGSDEEDNEDSDNEEDEAEEEEEEKSGDADEDTNCVTVSSTLRSEDDATNKDDGLILENLNNWQNSVSASDSGKMERINLKKEVAHWCLKAQNRLSMTGVAHKVDVDESQKACEDEARMDYDAEYLRRRDIRMKRIRRSAKNNNMPKTMISWFSEDHVVRRLGDNNDDIDSQFMTYPDPYNTSNRSDTTSSINI